jgi:hypothetical protein
VRVKLTYANVTATLALIIAVGGASAFAATQLPKNSVGAKQLKKNSVTTAKIKNEAVTAAKVKKGTLTGAQINLSTLGTVPSATSAQTLDGQSATQLASASKLHCPSGMALYDGVCYQEAAQSATDWTSAANRCWKAQLRLPTFGELIGFEVNNLTEKPPFEWTEPQWYLGGSETLTWAVAASANSGISWGAVSTGGSDPFRCVTLASN